MSEIDSEVAELFVDAWAEAEKAMRKFPQPNHFNIGSPQAIDHLLISLVAVIDALLKEGRE